MKRILNLLVLVLLANIAVAQAPQGIPYQAVARNSSGAILASTAISVRFTIRDSVATGAITYRETHSVTTSAQGMFSVNVGHGTPITGAFSDVNWGSNAKFMQVEMDPAGGTSFIDMGTTQMMSVPYALYAANSGGGGPWQDSAGHIHNTNATARVGIGTTQPRARLHVADSSVVFTGQLGDGDPPISGPGSRMMWYADKAAFRVGTVYGGEWDRENVGDFSFAMGRSPLANGPGSIAMGDWSNAGGGSVAIGEGAVADYGGVALGYSSAANGPYTLGVCGGSSNGNNSFSAGFFSYAGGQSCAIGFATTALNTSVAIGTGAVANQPNSLSLGLSTTASGDNSFAIGVASEASNSYSGTIGFGSTSSGYRSMSVGTSCTASGPHSTAMGVGCSSNFKNGAFAIGDISSGYSSQPLNDTENQMAMRFTGGYKLFTSSDLSTGAYMNSGDNSWSTISDRRKKENFATIDGEAFLKKISNFNLTSWNYKGQDPKVHRHYGPMAQDFYAAFGKDEYGTIGNDTTINQADMEGVSFTAIQALVKRTEELQKKNETLEKEVAALKGQNTTIINENSQLKAELSGRIEAIETELRKTKISNK